MKTTQSRYVRYSLFGSLGLMLSGACAIACSKPDQPAAADASPSAVESAAAKPPALDTDAMELPKDLGTVKIPEGNPQTDAKVKLGHQLFFDKRLSSDGSRACVSCHMNEDGNGGHDPLAIGPGEKKLTRHSPVIWNIGFLPKLYWDGRSDSLEAQGTAAWAGGNMGVGKDKLDAKAKEIGKIAGYKTAFAEVFPKDGVTATTIVQAISAYERTLVCDDTAYDKYAKGNKAALDAKQKEGLALFMGKAACTACHTPPFFSSAYMIPDGTYFNTGMGTQNVEEKAVDVGRMKVTEKESDWAAFKVPSLRNVSKSAPYFHDGSVAKLEDAVRFMAGGGHDNKNKSPLLTDKKLSNEEIQSLVTFLGALACPNKLEEPTLPQ